MRQKPAQEELVSVIVPVYNRASQLDGCIRSILAQSYGQLEIILVDDGSTDNTLSQCLEFAKTDPRIVVLHKSNGGPASARNMGLDHSKGQYIMFVDSDDRIHRRCVEKLLCAVIDHQADVAICDHVMVQNSDYQWNEAEDECRISLHSTQEIAKDALYTKLDMLFCWSKLWRRDCIGNTRFSDLMLCEDCLFTATCLLSTSGKAAYVKGIPMYAYLRNEKSITRTLNDRKLLDSLESAYAIIELTDQSRPSDTGIRSAGVCYMIDTAFYAYMHAISHELRNTCENLIRKYRPVVLSDPHAPVKPRAACLVSLLSMRLVYRLYHIVNRG